MGTKQTKTKSVDVTIKKSEENSSEQDSIIAPAQEVKNEQIEAYNILAKRISDFGNINVESLVFEDKWEEYFKEYEQIIIAINTFHSDYDTDNSVIADFITNVNYAYDNGVLAHNKWQTRQLKIIQDKLDKQQITNLSVFSIFMTLLTFLLANISKVVTGNAKPKTIILTNLILLCVSSTVFLFIGVFLGFVGKNDSKLVRVLKYIVLFALPFVFAAATLAVLFCYED